MFLRARRWLSYLWPVHERTVQGRTGPLELTWVNGQCVVHTETADQSYGSLHRVWQAAFRDASLRRTPPARILVLGFGAGSIARIVHHESGLPSSITGVDHDPAMMDLAQGTFGIRPGPRLDLVVEDATAFLQRRPGTYDLVCVDLFHGADLAPGIESPSFIALLKGSVAPGGLLIFNTIAYDGISAGRSEQLERELRLAFDAVGAARYEGSNLVYTCR